MFLQRMFRRQYSSKPRSGHADFYASLLPAMIPVALLGSAVYMVSLWQFFILSKPRPVASRYRRAHRLILHKGLHLVQSRLAHEKFLDDARRHICALEQEVDALHAKRA